MAQKIIDLSVGYGDIAADLGNLFPLQTNEAKDAVAPGTTKSTFKGNVPYRDAILDIRVSAGDMAVYTLGLPNPRMAGTGTYGQYAQAIRCDGTAHQYTTKFDHAAFSAHNWVAMLAGSILTYAAAPSDLTEFTVADDGGKLQVQVGDGSPVPVGGTELWVFQASGLKKTLMATATTPDMRKPITPRDLVYLEGSGATIERAILEFYCD